MQTPINVIRGENFENRSLVIDGISFENCRFHGCQLFYSAKDPTLFKDCVIQQCEWVFEDAAENMFALLSSLYRLTRGDGQSLVEAVFAGMRDGTLVGAAQVKADAVPA